MSEKFDVLVVCLGNVCRSPVAERLLRLRFSELLPQGDDAVAVSSAGLRAVVGSAIDPNAAAELERLGGDPSDFSSTQLTPAMVTGADLVLTATRQLRSRVLEEEPRALKRTFTIRELAALTSATAMRQPRVASLDDLLSRAAAWRGSVEVAEYDVQDPIGQSPDVHREVADLLDQDCTLIARALVGALLSDAGQP